MMHKRSHVLPLLIMLLLAACHATTAPGTTVQPIPSVVLSPTVRAAIPEVDPLPLAETSVAVTPHALPFQGDSMPPRCGRTDAIQRIQAFFDAFNRGDQAQLATFFGPAFKWYSVNEGELSQGGRFFLAYTPQSEVVPPTFPAGFNATVGQQEILLPYFAERHAHGERLLLQSLSMNYDSVRNLGGIAFTLTRIADDIDPRLGGPDHVAHGKGAMSCQDLTIVLWSMGMDSP